MENRPGKDPLVSVVVTTYFRNDSLREALESVREQEYEPIETLVVDGSGERHAEPVAEAYDVRYLPQSTDEGAQAARSYGAERAEGQFVNFLDDDDTMQPDKLASQVGFLTDHESIGVVYCGKWTGDGHRMMPDPDVRGDVLEHALRFEMTPSSPSTMLIRRSVLDEILPLGNRHGADDLGMKIELAQRTAFDFIDEPLVTIGDSEDSLGGSMENISGRHQVLETYRELYEQHPPDVRRTALAYTYLLEAEIRLNQQVWSLRALQRAVQAAYLMPGTPVSFVGYAAAALFGRPGRDLGRQIYFEFFVGEENRGKLT